MAQTGLATDLVLADDAGITAAARVICAGGCVAVPTETVYGLAADATNPAAVASIFAAKGRPSFNPLIIHVTDLAMAACFADITPLAETLAAQFWPGALTMVMPLRGDAQLAPAVTAGLGSVAVRCPAHPAMRALIAARGGPLAAPSANRSGAVSPTSAGHVMASLGGRIPLIVDGGTCAGGIESTIIAPMASTITMLRPGGITAQQITQATGLSLEAHIAGDIVAPGQLSSHYAPGKPMLLNCEAAPPDAFFIGFGGSEKCDFQLSVAGDLAEAAHNLFAALHLGTASAQPRIAVAPIPQRGIGIAINDRLVRAAA